MRHFVFGLVKNVQDDHCGFIYIIVEIHILYWVNLVGAMSQFVSSTFYFQNLIIDFR